MSEPDRADRDPFRVLIDAPRSNQENAARDEEMLREGGPSVRVTRVNDRAVSLGVGEPEGAEYRLRAISCGLPIIRRSTGGTGLLHLPGDIAWSIVLPRSDARVGRDFTRAFGRFGRGIVQTFSHHGIRSSWEPSPGLHPSYCLLGPRGDVIMAEGRILGGAAQHATGRALLHHGNLPNARDPEALQRIFGVDEGSGADRLTSLQELGLDSGRPEFLSELAEGIVAELDRLRTSRD